MLNHDARVPNHDARVLNHVEERPPHRGYGAEIHRQVLCQMTLAVGRDQFPVLMHAALFLNPKHLHHSRTLALALFLNPKYLHHSRTLTLALFLNPGHLHHSLTLAARASSIARPLWRLLLQHPGAVLSVLLASGPK